MMKIFQFGKIISNQTSSKVHPQFDFLSSRLCAFRVKLILEFKKLTERILSVE